LYLLISRCWWHFPSQVSPTVSPDFPHDACCNNDTPTLGDLDLQVLTRTWRIRNWWAFYHQSVHPQDTHAVFCTQTSDFPWMGKRSLRPRNVCAYGKGFHEVFTVERHFCLDWQSKNYLFYGWIINLLSVDLNSFALSNGMLFLTV